MQADALVAAPTEKKKKKKVKQQKEAASAWTAAAEASSAAAPPQLHDYGPAVASWRIDSSEGEMGTPRQSEEPPSAGAIAARCPEREEEAGGSSIAGPGVWARLTAALPGDSGIFRTKSQGISVSVDALIVGLGATHHVFQGLLVLLMAFSNVMLIMTAPDRRLQGGALPLFFGNLASVLCYAGLTASFGYSCYSKYLCELSDPTQTARVRSQLAGEIVKPLLGAWLCSAVWCFFCHMRIPDQAAVLSVLVFWRVYGNVTEYLFAMSFNLLLVCALWRPICSILESSGPAGSWRRRGAAVLLALAPLAFSLLPALDCTGRARMAHLFLVCMQVSNDASSFPALAHLSIFGLGILLAACRDRLIADLEPSPGAGGGDLVLPWHAVRAWFSSLGIVLKVSMVFFAPLGQIWWHEDLSDVRADTHLGPLIRRSPGGPSLIWLLSTVWPVIISTAVSGLLVLMREIRPVGGCFRLAVAELEHYSANSLYYLVVVDVLLAGLYRGFSPVGAEAEAGGTVVGAADPGHAGHPAFPLTVTGDVCCTLGILAAARFLHYLTRAAEK